MPEFPLHFQFVSYIWKMLKFWQNQQEGKKKSIIVQIVKRYDFTKESILIKSLLGVCWFVFFFPREEALAMTYLTE